MGPGKRDWLTERVAMLKAQNQRSEAQQLLVILHDKHERSKDEQGLLDVLAKAERAKDRAKEAEKNAAKMLGTRKEDERKARNHRLIQLGLLIDQAKLEEWDRGELLGGLLALAGTPADKRVGWKSNGDKLLAEGGK